MFVQRIDDDTYKAKGERTCVASPDNCGELMHASFIVAESPDADPRDNLVTEETQLTHCATALYKLMEGVEDSEEEVD